MDVIESTEVSGIGRHVHKDDWSQHVVTNKEKTGYLFSDGLFRSHATYYFIAAGKTHKWRFVTEPASPYHRMLYPLGKPQEGSRTFGRLPYLDGTTEAGSDQIFADGDFHFKEV